MNVISKTRCEHTIRRLRDMSLETDSFGDRNATNNHEYNKISITFIVVHFENRPL